MSYWDVAQELKPREQGEFYRAIMDYMFADEDRESELKGNVRICFKATKTYLKTSRNRSQAAYKSNASQAQAKRKRDAKEAQDKDKVQVQDKVQDESECTKPICPACGGRLALDLGSGTLRCEKCGGSTPVFKAVTA